MKEALVKIILEYYGISQIDINEACEMVRLEGRSPLQLLLPNPGLKAQGLVIQFDTRGAVKSPSVAVHGKKFGWDYYPVFESITETKKAQDETKAP